MAIEFPPPVYSANGDWNDPSSSQYHIQTDEGPERYFRYQTNSGQYRKEKRLEDGTVIGTYAWIDGDGLLRMRDYIADNEGYRILKSKNVYVGINRPISEAVTLAKKAPATSGTTVTQRPSIFTTLPQPFTPPHQRIRYTPIVQILPHSSPSSTPSTLDVTHISTTVEPSYSTTTERPLEETNTTPSYTNYPTTNPVSSTIPPNIYKQYIPSAPASVQILSTPSYEATPSSLYIPQQTASTIRPPLNSNSLEVQGLSGAPQYEHYSDDLKPFANPYIFHNGPTYPIDKNGQTFTGYPSNYLDNEPQRPAYDGISVTNDGFRYYIPRAYHEEVIQGNDKTGSFGYVDPFGIRRVIYYHATPEGGFQHRKNNRYVGFDATPYDPKV